MGFAATCAATLAATPAATTVTFNGASLYSGSATLYDGQQHVYSPVVNLGAPGDASITNDNVAPPFGIGNAASIHTVMALKKTATGSQFRLDGSASATWTGDPAYLTPSASSDNQFHYYFTVDTPFDLMMAYDMPATYGLNSDYYEVSARFDTVYLCGGPQATPGSCSGSNLFQFTRYVRQSDADKTINLHLLPGVYGLTIYGLVSVKTYHPGNITAMTQSVLTTNLNPVAGVPEPANWALLVAGFGLSGAALRRHRAYQGSVSPL